MRSRTVFLTVVTFLSFASYFVLLPMCNAQPSSIAVVPPSTTVTVGQTFTVSVTLSYAANLWAYQVELTFDKTKLQANSIIDAGYLGTTNGVDYLVTPPVVDNLNGKVSLGASRLILPAVTGGSPPPLATISFTALASGTATLHITTPPNGQTYLLDTTPPNGQLIPYTTTDGTVTITGGAPAVGGEWVPMNQLQLLTPLILQVSVVLALVVARGLLFGNHRKRRT